VLVDLLDVGRVVLGLALLIAGGEALVRGASTLATRLGIAPLVVGLVIVSASTSAPSLRSPSAPSPLATPTLRSAMSSARTS